MCIVHKNFTVFFSQASLMFSSKYEMPVIGVRRLKNKLFKCSIFTWKKHVGCVRFFILCLPFAQIQACFLWRVFAPASSLPGKLCPHVCTELPPSCLSDFSWNVISLKVPLTCTSEVITDHHELFFLFHNTYCNLQWSRIPLCCAVLQGTSSGSPLPRALPATHLVPNKYFWINECKSALKIMKCP